MSTTKDRQGPYTVERIEMKGRDWWTVVGPNAGGTPAMDNATAKDLCDRLNAAYQAGQADRDELVKALRKCWERMDGLNNGGFGPLTLKEDIDAMLQAEAILSRYPNP